MDYSLWINVAQIALWYIAATGVIAAFAIFVGRQRNKDDR